MRRIIACITVLLLFSTSAFSDDRSTPWLVSWPFFQNAQAPHGVIEGYGDWCVIDEGVHPGLDFAAEPDDTVLLPTDARIYNYHTYRTVSIGSIMLLMEDMSSEEGWGVSHLSIPDPSVFPYYDGAVISNHEPLAPCSLYSATTPRHMHLQWVEFVGGSPPDPVPGLYNPFDYFENSLAGYDEVQFNHVRWEEFLSPAGNRGIWFTPDNYETYLQLGFAPGNPDRNLFQSILSGAVDIAVAPFSAFQGLSDRDSAGVYSVSYEILRQDPVTLEYLPAASGAGNFGQRWLMEMRDELPNGDSYGYRALFPDGLLLVGGKFDSLWWYNMNAYTVTNSGAAEPSSWANGWSNVYTDTVSSYTNSWSDGICQGAWDTFLAKPGISGAPASNREAFFPDGRYAVEVTAVSHGSREEGTMMLPVDDLDKLFPATEGIFVDNFLPGVEDVIVYSKSGSSVDPKYMAEWMGEGSPDNSEYREQLAYLEELQEDLRFFQSLDRGEEVAVPESFQIDPDLPGGFIAGASFSTATASPGNTANTVNSVSPEVDGCGVLTDSGMNPVRFLQEEIARVEGGFDSYRNRNLYVSQYGYIPYGGASSVDGESLNMLVIYSEPTMVENSEGVPIVDKVWMRGYINEDVLWDSREHGIFVRDTPAGNAEHTAYLQEQMGSAFPSEPDAEYAVHYTFQGDLPSEFCGTVQVLIGADTRSSTVGPRDLAGHLMDADPTTIPVTRKSYESWASVVPGSLPGYESQSEPHYLWGVPFWNRYGGTVIASIADDTVAVVDLSPIGLQDASFYGGCLPWYGFWMYQDEAGARGFDIPVVLHDGTVRHHSFSTKYPKGNPNDDDVFWSGGPGSCDVVSGDTQYFWMGGSECNRVAEVSDAYIYSVNSETGATNSYNVCSGWCSGLSDRYSSSDLIFPCSIAFVMKIYHSGAALIKYSYYPYPWSEPVVGYKVYNPPGGGNLDFSEESCLVTHTEDFAFSDNEPFTVLSNPVGETLDVEISCASWKLSVFDISGRCVVSESGVSTEDRSVISIDAGELSSGVYMLKVEVEGVEQFQSITVVH